MNRKEFQQWLDQFPEDTTVEVVVNEDSWAGRNPRLVEFDPTVDFGEHFDFIDLVDNPFVSNESSNHNKRFLILGST